MEVIGFVFGLIGFVFALRAMDRIGKLEKQLIASGILKEGQPAD